MLQKSQIYQLLLLNNAKQCITMYEKSIVYRVKVPFKLARLHKNQLDRASYYLQNSEITLAYLGYRYARMSKTKINCKTRPINRTKKENAKTFNKNAFIFSIFTRHISLLARLFKQKSTGLVSSPCSPCSSPFHTCRRPEDPDHKLSLIHI